MISKTKIALAAALVLGAASAALANDIETNPSTAQSVREWQEFQGQKHMGNVGTSYGYFGSSSQQDDGSQSGKRSRSH
jgi:opacity protein-like surface antigen